jgi:hypothetical protein
MHRGDSNFICHFLSDSPDPAGKAPSLCARFCRGARFCQSRSLPHCVCAAPRLTVSFGQLVTAPLFPPEDAFPNTACVFDYVLAGTFHDQWQGYFRYQLSWGGRAINSAFSWTPTFAATGSSTGFWTGSTMHAGSMTGARATLLLELWDWFRETDAAESARQRAYALGETPHDLIGAPVSLPRSS